MEKDEQVLNLEKQGSFAQFDEQGTSLLAPIPKPSIGAQESFLGNNNAEGDNSEDDSSDYCSIKEKGMTDHRGKILARQRYADQKNMQVESFEHITVDEDTVAGVGAGVDSRGSSQHGANLKLSYQGGGVNTGATSRKLDFDDQGGSAVPTTSQNNKDAVTAKDQDAVE